MANSRFTAARRSDQGKRFSFLKLKRKISQNIFRLVITERYVIKNDLSAYVLKSNSIGGILFRLLIDNLNKSLEAGHTVLILLDKADELFDRRHKQRDIQ